MKTIEELRSSIVDMNYIIEELYQKVLEENRK